MDAPGHLSPVAQSAWSDIVAAHPAPEKIVGPALEAFCVQVAHLRDAQARIEAEGLVVADEKGRPTPHPALAIARAAQDEIRRWGDRFRPPSPPVRRRRGPMYDATTRAVNASDHLKGKREFEGVVEAARTLAWIIDEAQREGAEALAKASFGPIPTYLKACEALQITPASRPVAKVEEKKGGGRLQALRGGMAGGASASAG